MNESEPCANCAAVMSGEYCAACGQQRFRPEHRHFAHLAQQFLAELTDFDSRFWRSLLALLFRPGRLSRDYLDGRRARWLSPVALFLFANLVYFLVPAVTDFDLPLRNHVSEAVLRDFAEGVPVPRLRASGAGQVHSRYTEPWVRARLTQLQARLDQRAQAQGMPVERAFERLQRDYELASANISKLLIVLHVPFLALALMLLMAGSRRYYAEHFAVALHYFAFLLLFVEVVLLPAGWLAQRLGVGTQGMPAAVTLVTVGTVLLYGVLLVRRTYDAGWPRAALGSVGLLAALAVVHINVYRGLQFSIVLALT